MTKSVDLPLGNISIFWTFLKDSLFRSKTCALYPDYSKTTFSGLICPPKNLIKSSNFWQKAWTNPLGKLRFFCTFIKTSLFWFKIVLFYPKNPKNDLFWLDLPKRHSWYINSLCFWQTLAMASFNSLPQLLRQNNNKKKKKVFYRCWRK